MNQPKTIWLTGLSGSGKSTIAEALKSWLNKEGIYACVLDGDILRSGLNSDLEFSPADRKENVRRVAEVAKLLNEAGFICIVALISPYKKDRRNAAKIIGNGFVEVFVDADIETCRKRDTKGLYKKADSGEVINFTGISSPYEKPENPMLTVDTDFFSINEAVEKIYYMLLNSSNIPKKIRG